MCLSCSSGSVDSMRIVNRVHKSADRNYLVVRFFRVLELSRIMKTGVT